MLVLASFALYFGLCYKAASNFIQVEIQTPFCIFSFLFCSALLSFLSLLNGRAVVFTKSDVVGLSCVLDNNGRLSWAVNVIPYLLHTVPFNIDLDSCFWLIWRLVNLGAHLRRKFAFKRDFIQRYSFTLSDFFIVALIMPSRIAIQRVFSSISQNFVFITPLVIYMIGFRHDSHDTLFSNDFSHTSAIFSFGSNRSTRTRLP